MVFLRELLPPKLLRITSFKDHFIPNSRPVDGSFLSHPCGHLSPLIPATVQHGPMALADFISYPALHSPARVPLLCLHNSIPILFPLLSEPVCVPPSFKPWPSSTAGRRMLIPSMLPSCSFLCPFDQIPLPRSNGFMFIQRPPL